MKNEPEPGSNKPTYMIGEKELKNQFQIENIKEGLTQVEAKRRLDLYGPNLLKEEKTPKWKLFLKQFNNMIIYILMVAAILTLFMGHYGDAIIISLVILINSFIGYYQETHASDALDQIKSMLSTVATVYRAGERIDITAEELVIGDIVYLEAGDHVPADLRIIDEDNLKIQESALTGEADSVEKSSLVLTNSETPLAERTNMAYASTSVTNGSGLGIIVATADKTEIGKVSQQVSGVKETKTPLIKEIDGLGKWISYLIIGAAILLFILGLYTGTYSKSVLALAIVTMIVGSVPEGLPAITSVILAMGVSDMAKNKNTIIKTLPAAETLGSVDIVATDKTGTLTKNEMTIQDIFTSDATYTVTGTGYKPVGEIQKDSQKFDVKNDSTLEMLLISGHEANDTFLVEEDEVWNINGEPTDASFITLYHKGFGMDIDHDYTEIDRLPFDSDYRYIARLDEDKNGDRIIFIKGATDKIFEMASATEQSFDSLYWQERVDALTKQGKRVIAVGYRRVENSVTEIEHGELMVGITLLGIVGIIDPPREEVIDALKQMRGAGIEVKMITGDHPMTAKAIGEKLGLADEIKAITGPELDKLSKEALAEIVLDYQVFARATPKNKLDIIEAYQANGKVTAMTGDGVNDAPALKKADIGVAMGIKGSDVAKGSADMILTDDNFSTMAIAIEEGRMIYENIKKSILFLLPTSFAEGLIIAFTILSQQEMPLQATQLLWINMVSAITIQFAFIFEPAERGIMKRQPRQTGMSLMNAHDAFQMFYVSVLTAIISLIAHDWLLAQGADRITANTMMVNIIIMSKIFYLFSIRTSAMAFSKEFFANKKLFLIIGAMLLLQCILFYVPFMQKSFQTEPLTVLEWSVSILAGLIVLCVAEFDKFIRLKLQTSK